MKVKVPFFLFWGGGGRGKEGMVRRNVLRGF